MSLSTRRAIRVRWSGVDGNKSKEFELDMLRSKDKITSVELVTYTTAENVEEMLKTNPYGVVQ